MDKQSVAHLNTELLQSLPNDGPVVMANLVRLRDKSSDGNGSGWDAYQRYSAAVIKLLKAHNGKILWAGDIQAVALGIPDAHKWNYAVLVRYPSRDVFIAMMTSPAYAIANVERENALADHVIFAVKESFSRFGG
jgi:uncharacterized protein (DUF1330 family)